jgi:single-stranded-DNA-specific exonuclease
MSKLTKNNIKNILEKRLSNEDITSLKDLPSPFTLKDMQKSCKRIEKAIKEKEKIVVIGDYDVDGVVSSVMIKEFFDSIGKNIKVIIPNRFTDGYGISENIVHNIEADLIITVDNGISANQAALACIEKKIDLIITDHHTTPNILPQAYSIINQKQSDCKFVEYEICGATIVWYLIAGMKKTMGLDIDLKSYLDILSIAIIADLMPLKSINRVLVKSGLKEFNKTSRTSLLILKNSIKKNRVNSEDIAFLISPKINSAGRMDSAIIAFDFLLQRDNKKAMLLHDRLNSLNSLRKQSQQSAADSAIQNADNSKDIIIVYSKDYSEGVIGIVASRLVDKFGKPSIVFNKKDSILKGSARSIGNIDIYKLIDKSKEFILGFGGHKAAAGLSVRLDMFDKFKTSIEKNASLLNKSDFKTTNSLIGDIDLKDIDLELISMLDMFEPYGKDNQKPIFKATNLQIQSVRFMGNQNQHMALKLKQTDKIVDAVMFFTEQKFDPKDVVDCIFSINKNIFNNNISAQLIIDTIDLSNMPKNI